jgi:glycosyltransferase involved in cell wall biosynthesis
MKETFYISCPIDTYSGYGARSRDFVKALIESDKYQVKILSQRWGNTRKGFISDFKEWGFLEKHITTDIQIQPDIWCQVTVPNEFQKVGKYNIGLTAGIETTACAPQWIEGCNNMDLVLTSSNHSKNVFKSTTYQVKNKETNQEQELKLTTPIEVLIEGADLDVYKTLKTPMTNDSLFKNIDSIKENFAYLFVGHWLQGDMGEDRKNVGLMIKAFYEVFKNKHNAPALILKVSCGKSSHMDRREVMRRIHSIRKSISANFTPNIYLIHGDLSNEEMNEMYNHPKIKAMISATKGEGFGRPLLEFALLGKPIIASGWSGQLDFLDSKFTALMGGTLTDIHPSAQQKDMLIQGSKWFSVDHGQLGNLLVDVKKSYKDWSKKSKIQAGRLKKSFSFGSMQTQLLDILDKYVKIPKQVELSIPKRVKTKNKLPNLTKI